MVECMELDDIFASLADRTRRDILKRLDDRQLSISEIALPYNLTFAAVSKHLKVLEKANLITKKRRGKEQLVSISPEGLKKADEYIESYRRLWEGRLDSLEEYLRNT